MGAVEPTLQMWAVLGLLSLALLFFITEWVPIEVASLGLLCALLLLFQIFPAGPDGQVLVTPERLLAGFANPALLTVLALLVVGEALVQTGALDSLARGFGRLPLPPMQKVALVYGAIMAVSGLLNNTPVVVIFIPIMQALAMRLGLPAGRVMMPVSFAAILGGMTTLIGSSTNLLVSGALIQLDRPPLAFFEFTVPGLIIAILGLLYVIFVAPRLLPDRASVTGRFAGDGKHFIAQWTVPVGSPLVGEAPVAGLVRALPDVTVHLILRGEEAVLPPFDGLRLASGDTLIVAATRAGLAQTAVRHPGLVPPDQPARKNDRPDGDGDGDERLLVEAMVAPSSGLVGLTLDQVDFPHRHRCRVLGLQRRARMMRGRMSEVRLAPGDVLLVLGRAGDIEQLRGDRDLVVVSGTAGQLPKRHHTGLALAVFAGIVGLAALEVLPIIVAALIGVAILVAARAITPRQAALSLDRKVVLLVAAALALGEALQVTGGAAFLANAVIGAIGGLGNLGTLSAYFLLVALFTNVLSNNACAVLFTPIGIGVAERLGVDPHVFAVATVLAANCSFATPIGYQTNLLVMGPGHYRFGDFVKVGGPLVILVWLAFTTLAPWLWPL